MTLEKEASGGKISLQTDHGTEGLQTVGYFKSATANTVVQLNGIADIGYEFIGWRIGGLVGKTLSTDLNYEFTANKDLQLYAMFRKTYTLTFNSNGGTGTMDSVSIGGSYTLPTTCSFTAPEGMKFKGWSLRNDGGIITEIYMDINKTVYAIWETAPTYTVTFKDYDGTVLKTEKVQEGKSATAPKNPTRKGYTFTKWDKDFSNITSDLTVTAVYTKKQSSDIDITPYMFNAKFYADANPDVKKAFGNNYKQAYEHFINYGINEGRVGSKYFDAKYYLEKNEDLKNVFKNNYSKALEHFVQYGINEGRLASKIFNVKAYKNKNADLSKEFGNNWKQYFKHYMIWGQKENRECV